MRNINQLNQELLSLQEISTTPEAIIREVQVSHLAESELDRAYQELKTRFRKQQEELKQAKRQIQQEVLRRQQLAQSLAKNELLYRKVVEQQRELVCRLSPELTLTFVNTAYCRYFAKKSSQLIGRKFTSLIPAKNLSLVEAHLGSLGRENPTGMIEYEVTKPTGEVTWQQWHNQAIFNQQGNLIEFQSVGRDITERRVAEVALQKSQARLAGILDLAEDAIIAVDKGQRITLFNQGAEKIFGYTTLEILGKSLDVLLPDSFLDLKSLYSAKFSQSSQLGEIMARRQDGSQFPAEVSLSQFNSGAEVIFTIILRDISERKQYEIALQQVNSQLQDKVSQLEQHNREMTLMNQMSDFLQSCHSLKEAYTALPRLVKPLFPENFGGVFLVNTSGNLYEVVASWGEQITSQPVFSVNDCWALRRSRTYWVEDTHSGLLCDHVHEEENLAESLCVPIMAQGKALGLFHLSSPIQGILNESKRHLATAVAENIALALANLQLREELHAQSIRDPLTGLFNRRYLEESLKQQIHFARRKKQPLGMIMLDVDYFKRFNDTYGHDAGDLVLQKIAAYLQNHIRGSDIACRYGGEEMMIILPEASLENTRQRAEQLRSGIKGLNIRHNKQSLGKITASLGVSAYPEHGSSSQELFEAADSALYQAKAQGRDRVITAQ